ncbi:hypothetical protein [Paenibacillus sp. GCM10012306]|uniref:hypothetical protein n=1 Tax=Paenibacillus sp. GCM10012306 TaxID=3317342 RepID=UPI003623458A
MRQDGELQQDVARARQYIAGEGSPEERDVWEQRLLEDDDALLCYLEALDELQGQLPSLESPKHFTENVMGSLPAVQKPAKQHSEDIGPSPETQRRTRWYEQAIVHYVIAASLTLILLSSGVFDRMLSGELGVFIPEGKHSSYSQQIKQATSSWLDYLMNGNRK